MEEDSVLEEQKEEQVFLEGLNQVMEVGFLEDQENHLVDGLEEVHQKLKLAEAACLDQDLQKDQDLLVIPKVLHKQNQVHHQQRKELLWEQQELEALVYITIIMEEVTVVMEWVWVEWGLVFIQWVME